MRTWLGALALDVALGEPPPAAHPVVLTGRAIGALERDAPLRPRPAMVRGAILVFLPAAVAWSVGALAGRLRPALARTFAVTWLLKTAFALRELDRAALRVERDLRADRLDDARDDLRALVSRPTRDLDRAHVASAAIESVAENLCDSYVAPLFWYRLGGLPAALAYRVVNTADAMVGYRGRYEYLGKTAARLDDALNWVPARLAALAIAVAAPLVGAGTAATLRAALPLAGRTASPNAGLPMAVAAVALGVRLEKPGHYLLGDGRESNADDIARGRLLVLAAAGLVTAIATLIAPRR